MNIHDEFDTFLSNRKLILSHQQRTAATLFLNANQQNPTWLRARRSGVTTLFNALEDFYKYHDPNMTAIECRFWYKTKCQTCGVVNESAADSSAGWRFYSSGGAVSYTCPHCPVLPDSKIGFER